MTEHTMDTVAQGRKGTVAGIRFCVLAALCCLLLAGGCASRQGGSGGGGASFSVPDDDPTPLSPKEVAALNSTGHVDKSLPPEAMDDVARQYKYFLRKGRNSVCVFSKRAENYLSYARKVFRSRGMPEELAYLAIVESGYRVDARSPVGATGAWQFMPPTGERFGLTQNWFTDERLDPYESTEAAADYLQKLHEYFGDWPTAIAAYNAGEGKIGRAKAGTGGKDFFEVKARNHMLDEKAQLRDETKQYVPRFLAVTKIMRNLPELGFEPINPENAPGVLRLTARPGTDLNGLADACGMNWGDFASYNRHHKRRITDTNRSTFVYVPARIERQAMAFLSSPRCTAYADWGAVRVASNADSWDKISRRSGIPAAQLRALNPGESRLSAGQTVLAPRSVDMSARAVAALDNKAQAQSGNRGRASSQPAGRQVAQSAAQGGSHTLQAGETLYAVARQYNINVKDLQEHNNISSPNMIHAGTVLRIPGRAVAQSGPVSGGSDGRVGRKASAGAAKAAKNTYLVQARDSLWKIAREHNVSVEDLKRWNGVDEKTLRAGSVLVVEQ
ncbi:lytic transglycosylase domain-containing protein [Desulfovibrio sp.]|uniref:lytic transglycosylase domain-containing protein n=1 Tax=Desulfovibrio sp. TaxID=885 RepID=UPI0025C56B01|nr:lytic transglycosylase domain-containing protein [Desulfovibrio sp.]